MRMIDPLLAELEQEAATTRRVLERVPEDRLSWKPHAKSMSLGELAFHIASTPGGVSSLLRESSCELPSPPSPPGTKAEILGTFEESLKTAKDILGGWDDAAATSVWRLTKDGKELFAAPKIAVARMIILNHSYHHRGQLSVYLRELDVPVPSIYGPSADENPFA